MANTSNMISVTVRGIPALVEVHAATVVPGSFSFNAASSDDYYGYSDLDYTLCDRKGYPAAWLEKKMTPANWEALEESIWEALRKQRSDD